MAEAVAAEVRYIDAVRDTLDAELATDESVVLLGEDLTVGGPFGATKGLVDRYGPWRVRDTPISEATVMGLAVGASLSGLRPVVEIMVIDFLTLAMDQLVNHAAKLRYMSGGSHAVPLTVRVQFGATGGYGAHHSQSLEAWLAHVPGLRVVAPSTPADAAALLRAAIRTDDPVVVLEHRALYWKRGPAAEPPAVEATATDPFTARVRRPGRDVTILAWSRMVETALTAANRLAEDGIEAEVVDVRSLSPLDLDPIVASAHRTRRVAIVHEAVTTGGLGGELAAAITERAFSDLLAPVHRIGAPFVPPPAGPALEALFVPSIDRVVDDVRALATATEGGR
jgi:pyruvate dehydrogenase E1 component beta subunit